MVSHESTTKVINTNSSLELSEQEIYSLSIKATNKDGVAARKLGVYYSAIKLDDDMAEYWYLIGAENGDVVCQYNLAYSYLHRKKDEVRREKAIYWLRKAASTGDPDSIKYLNRLGVPLN